MPWLKCPFAVGTLGREMTVRRVSACPRAVKVIADHATARHTSQMSTDFSFTLPPPVVSVSAVSKLRIVGHRGTIRGFHRGFWNPCPLTTSPLGESNQGEA